MKAGGKLMKKYYLLSLIGACVFCFLSGLGYGLFWGGKQVAHIKQQYGLLVHSLMEKQEKEIAKIQKQKIQQFKIAKYTITGYAPLDPKAKEGMCYSGDRTITASGKQVEPGITIATDPSIPFGTWIWIEGFGWRRVDDRGGRIKGKKIDICFQKQEEALKFGRQKRIVVIPVWEKEDE